MIFGVWRASGRCGGSKTAIPETIAILVLRDLGAACSYYSCELDNFTLAFALPLHPGQRPYRAGGRP